MYVHNTKMYDKSGIMNKLLIFMSITMNYKIMLNHYLNTLIIKMIIFF